jgi:hypothetical protein
MRTEIWSFSTSSHDDESDPPRRDRCETWRTERSRHLIGHTPLLLFLPLVVRM